MKRVHSSKGRPAVPLPKPGTPSKPAHRQGISPGISQARSPGQVLRSCTEQYSVTQPQRSRNRTRPRPTMVRNRPGESHRVELCRQLWEANWDSSSSAGSTDSLSIRGRSEDESEGSEDNSENRNLTVNNFDNEAFEAQMPLAVPRVRHEDSPDLRRVMTKVWTLNSKQKSPLLMIPRPDSFDIFLFFSNFLYLCD